MSSFSISSKVARFAARNIFSPLVPSSLALASVCSLLVAAPSHAGSWQKLNAVYEVPAPKDLAPFAMLGLKNLKTRERGGTQELNYTIPRELTGKSVQIHVVSQDGGKTFKGEGCSMSCSDSSCKVHYPGLIVDLAEVRQYLMESGISGQELADRLQVVRYFTGELGSETSEDPGLNPTFAGFLAGGDPFGIIHIKR